MDLIINILGIAGLLLVGGSVLLEELNKLDKNHHTFAIMNVTGSILLFINAIYFKVTLFAVLNGFLILVGSYGMYKVYKK